MPDEIRDDRSPTALAYRMTEEARLLLEPDPCGELQTARTAAAEAAYYLSDAIAPDARRSLLALAEQHVADGGSDASAAPGALRLLVQVADDVEELLTGPDASSELHIALRALRRAIGTIARELGLGAARQLPQAPGAHGRLQSRHG
jgi:hypothetical protein